MTKIISAIYEDGVIRPLKNLPLAEHQRIELRIDIPKSIVKSTRAIIHLRANIAGYIANSPRLGNLGV